MSEDVRWFTIDEARALMPAVHAHVTRLIPLRADLARRARALDAGDRTQRTAIKALEAHLSELLDWFRDQSIQLKGYAPLLIDFPMRAGVRHASIPLRHGLPSAAGGRRFCEAKERTMSVTTYGAM
jgi:hypothetical protein